MCILGKKHSRQEKGELTHEESRNLHVFFENELHSNCIIFAISLTICVGIYAVSVLQIDAESRFIYVLYRIFLVSVFMSGLCCLRIICLLLAMFLIDRGRYTVFRARKYRRCINYSKQDLKGKEYYVLHVLWYRYAFRVPSG